MGNDAEILNRQKPMAEPRSALIANGLWWLGVHASVQWPQRSDAGRYLYHWGYEEYDLTFESEFHDSVEQFGGKIRVYNLSDNTIEQIQPGMTASATGGYGYGLSSDQGVYLYGFIENIHTNWQGSEKYTELEIKNIEADALSTRVQETFSAPIAASFVLRQLCAQSGLPLGEFLPRSEHMFTQTLTLEGELGDLMDELAALCGVWAYVVHGVLYVRDLRKDLRRNCLFLSEVSGLLETPEVFVQERNSRYLPQGESLEVLRGYRVRSLLNHRLIPGVGVQLSARGVQGYFAVKECRHVYDGCGGYTEAVVLA